MRKTTISALLAGTLMLGGCAYGTGYGYDDGYGPGGGYTLAKDPKDTPLSEIILAVNEPMKMTRCGAEDGNKDGCMADKARCTGNQHFHRCAPDMNESKAAMVL